MRVLGISGRSGHGKDYAAQIAKDIAEREFGLKVGIWSMAHPVKARVYGMQAGNYTFEQVWYNKPPEIRHELQQEGTQRSRMVYGDDFWLLQAEAYIKLFEIGMGLDLVVVPDIRFPNEVDFALLGGRAPGLVHDEMLETSVTDIHKLTPALEDLLLDEDPQALYSKEVAAVETASALYAEELYRGHGACLRIKSNRPTLTGEAAQHISETALDGLPDTAFTAILTNMRRTTSAGLRTQLRPIVQGLFPDAVRRRRRTRKVKTPNA